MIEALGRLQNTCLVHVWRTWLGTFLYGKYFGLFLQNNILPSKLILYPDMRPQSYWNDRLMIAKMRELGFGSCQMLMLWSMRDFLTIAVHFFNVSCAIFFLSLNVNALVNKYFLSMKSKCVAAFKVGWLIF